MPRLALPDVTLCAVDDRCPALAREALARSMMQADFARVVLFSHDATAVVNDPVELVDVGPIRSGAAYSRFILRELPHRIVTPFVLVTQWDGFVVDASAWTNEFLNYDYIGAAWDDQPEACAVGNGGFSLRSQRLLRAGLDDSIEDQHPEDIALCRWYRSALEARHGIRVAPLALARRFAFENESPAGPTFGFHGPKNLPRFVDASTLECWIEQLPDDFFGGRDSRRLARALLAQRMPRLARRVAARRMLAGRTDPHTQAIALVGGLWSRFVR